VAALEGYERGDVDLAEVQMAIASVMDLLESPDRELGDAMREAEGEIEILRFTAASESEERAAALRILKPLRLQIEAALT
jgi:hypothetical protein